VRHPLLARALALGRSDTVNSESSNSSKTNSSSIDSTSDSSSDSASNSSKAGTWQQIVVSAQGTFRDTALYAIQSLGMLSGPRPKLTICLLGADREVSHTQNTHLQEITIMKNRTTHESITRIDSFQQRKRITLQTSLGR
jgi:hypothetical protein